MIRKRLTVGSCLLALAMMFLSGCVMPREGYYDRAHHRYYHDHDWHHCVKQDIHCR
ncbi:MAG: hypothetical protein ACREPU_00815 [Rhodanobacteraceae bacterium]